MSGCLERLSGDRERVGRWIYQTDRRGEIIQPCPVSVSVFVDQVRLLLLSVLRLSALLALGLDKFQVRIGGELEVWGQKRAQAPLHTK